MDTTVPTTVLDALEFESLQPQEQETLLLELGEILFSSSMIRFLESIDEEGKEKLSQLLEANAGEEELQALIEQYPEESNQAVDAAVAELTDDILTITGHQPA